MSFPYKRFELYMMTKNWLIIQHSINLYYWHFSPFSVLHIPAIFDISSISHDIHLLLHCSSSHSFPKLELKPYFLERHKLRFHSVPVEMIMHNQSSALHIQWLYLYSSIARQSNILNLLFY